MSGAFSASLSSTQSNVTGDGTAYTIICDNEITDNDGVYDNTTGIISTAYFTDLIYVLAGCITISGLTALHTSMSIDLVTSTRTYNLFSFAGVPLSSTFQFNISENVQIEQYETMTLQVTIGGSLKTVDISGDGSLSLTSITGNMI